MSFGGILRQSTAVDTLIGPFVDSTDGDAEETGLTIAQADVRLSKNGQAGAQKNDNTSAAHDADGFYNCELDATDTNTVGQLTLYVHVAGALCVRHDYQVVEEAVYDALYAASAVGPLLASSTGSGLTAVPWNASWDTEVQSEVTDALSDTTAGAVPWQGCIDQGTAQSATGTTLVLRAGAAFADDEIIGATIVITGGTTGVGQARAVTDYVSATDTATVEAWTTTPTGTITYKIFATAPSSGGSGLDAAGVRAAIGLASANLDTQLSGLDGKLDTIDNFLDTEVAAILADTNELQTDWADGGRLDLILDARASQTSVDDLPTNAELATALGTADDAVLTAIAALNNLSSAQAQTAAAAALTAYDSPTNAEMEARTLAAASYATATNLATVDTVADAIKLKTDSLTFTQSGHVDANIQRVNDVLVDGTGAVGDEWGPA